MIKKVWNSYIGLIERVLKLVLSVPSYFFSRARANNNNKERFMNVFLKAFLARKILLFSLMILAITIPLLYLVFKYQPKVEAAWMDDNWGQPVGWWKMDECQGGTANDSSGNGNNGTITIGATGSQTAVGTCTTSGTAWGNGVTGKYNSSLNFDGTDDWINAGQVLSTDQTKPFTLTAWAKGASGGMGTWRTIVGTNTSFAQIAFSSGNAIVFGQNGGGGWWQTGPTMVADTWYHVVGIYDGTNARLYVDGVLKSGPTARTFTNAHGVTVMGRYQTGGGELMNGMIDDARVYNYALTATQVKQLYNQDSSIRFGPSTGSP